ncbi:Vegetative incompatibility protein HET-E-1 [Colletotrichum sp. SAR 10_70]|nr:Vegetative incompatibility protein HET-E-1 [Colletotrichum sp. SAR 10_71]KAI8190548.1 Vegetative incompatibility protein HET-E-1 [Colletotrichum sp. SAR 10_70]
MPVTIQIADHPARTWSQPRATTPDDVLRKACPRNGDEAYDWSPEPTARDPRRRLTKRNVIQSSFSSEYLRKTHITPSQNGFLWAVYHAYSNHHHLHIRPEDIWFAILTQLSFYINANSESLRSLFVEHEGRKKLKIRLLTSTMESTDFGGLAQRFSEMISSNVKDEELHDWIMPSFTTTSDNDRVVASILFMGAMQNYFSYEAQLRCGLPSVTLQGDVADYEDILARLQKIEEFGDEPKQFVKLMRPILEHMIMSFNNPDSPQVEVFWNKIAKFHSRGSGGDHVSGWLGVFSFWSASGQTVMGSSGDWQPSIVDGVPRMKVLMKEFAAGYASVPVIIIEPGTTHHCTMSAGSIGIQAARDSSGGNFDDGLEDYYGMRDGRGKNSYGVWLRDLHSGHVGRRTREEGPSQFSDLTKIRSLTGWVMWEDFSDGEGVPESGTVDRPGRQRRR